MENETKTAAKNFMSSLEDMAAPGRACGGRWGSYPASNLLNNEEWKGVVDMKSAREAVRALRFDDGKNFLARNLHKLIDAKKADRFLSDSLWETLTMGALKISRKEHTMVDWNFLAICLLALLRPESLMLEALRIPEVGKTLFEVAQYE